MIHNCSVTVFNNSAVDDLLTASCVFMRPTRLLCCSCSKSLWLPGALVDEV